MPGPGNGYVSVFDTDGNFLHRVASRNALDAPWGLALAPAGFGQFGNALLVGNFGDGTIHAYNPDGTDALLGTLTDPSGHDVAIDGLWALTFGGGGNGGSPDTLFFTAGIDDETHGLFGSLQAVPEPNTLVLVALGGLGLFMFRCARARKI